MLSNAIETVVQRSHGRPRRAQDSSAQEAEFRGEVLTEPEDVCAEIANQVEAEASTRLTEGLADLRESCPWRHAVPPQAAREPNMLAELSGPYGRQLFALVVARLPDKAPGPDGVVNNVWRHLPAALLDRLWDYFAL